MRTPAALLLISLCLSACGQSGDLYRRDENADGPDMAPREPATAAPQAVPVEPTDEQKKKDEEEAAKPASTPAADSNVPSTSKPPAKTP